MCYFQFRKFQISKKYFNVLFLRDLFDVYSSKCIYPLIYTTKQLHINTHVSVCKYNTMLASVLIDALNKKLLTEYCKTFEHKLIYFKL